MCWDSYKMVVRGNICGAQSTESRVRHCLGLQEYYSALPQTKSDQVFSALLIYPWVNDGLSGAEYSGYIRLIIFQYESHPADKLPGNGNNGHALRHPFTVRGEGV